MVEMFKQTLQWLQTMGGWIWTIVQPDPTLWWLWILTLPLTFGWIIWSSPKTILAMNKLGGIIPAGTLALFIAMMFYGTMAGLALSVFGVVMSLINLDFSWNLIYTIFRLLISGIVIWFLSKIPGLKWVITTILGYVNKAIRWCWDLRKHAETNSSLVYQAIGALGVAGVINCTWVVHLTDKLLPGIIPGVSAIIGLAVFAVNGPFGKQLKAEVQAKTKRVDEQGRYRCPHEGWIYPVNNMGLRIPDPKRPGKHVRKWVKCGHWVEKTNPVCPQCGGDNWHFVPKCVGKDCKKSFFPRKSPGGATICPDCGEANPPAKEGFKSCNSRDGKKPEPTGLFGGLVGSTTKEKKKSKKEKKKSKKEKKKGEATAIELEACPTCGSRVKAKKAFCTKCGTPMRPRVRVAPQPPPQAPRAEEVPTAAPAQGRRRHGPI